MISVLWIACELLLVQPRLVHGAPKKPLVTTIKVTQVAIAQWRQSFLPIIMAAHAVPIKDGKKFLGWEVSNFGHPFYKQVGLEEGDIITKVDDKAVPSEIAKILEITKVSKIELIRRGEKMQLVYKIKK